VNWEVGGLDRAGDWSRVSGQVRGKRKEKLEKRERGEK
jgi:hypothetical protein